MIQFFTAIFFGFCFFCIPEALALKIEITQGQIAPTPIAITDFVDETGERIGQELAAVITNDLKSSGLFAPINPAAFIQDPKSVAMGPRFDDWKALLAQFLVTGRIVRNGGSFTIEFRLFDVFSKTQVLGLSLNADPSKWRRVAHMISDEIYKRVTGETGYFNTKIAYIDESGPRGRGRTRRLALMDWDGYDNKYLTDGSNIVLTPRFSPNNRDIVYLAYHNKTAHVYLYNIESGRNQPLGKFEGMTFAPRFSPDGGTIVMSLSKNGSTAIYAMDVQTKQIRLLTQHEHNLIDTSPAFSADGKQIVFSSDRTKSQQLYVMDSNGSNVHRISFGEGSYSEPVWSPRGDLIAFTKKLKGQFYIGVMNTDGSGERLIAQGFLVETPSWTPNGRVVLFAREGRTGKGFSTSLCSVDLTGRNLQKIKTPREASCGYWSDLLSKAPSS